MAIRIKRRDISDAFRALQAVGNIGFKNDHTIARKLARNLRGLRDAEQETEEERDAIVETHAQRDETNNVRTEVIGKDGEGQPIKQPLWENPQAAKDALQAFWKEEVEVSGEPFTDAEIQKTKQPISGTLLAALGPYYPLEPSDEASTP